MDRRDFLQGSAVVGDETRFQHQVFGWITRESQLGEGNEVARCLFRHRHIAHDHVQVRVDVSDSRIHLRQSHAKRRCWLSRRHEIRLLSRTFATFEAKHRNRRHFHTPFTNG